MNNSNQSATSNKSKTLRPAVSSRFQTIKSILALPFLFVLGGLGFVQPCTSIAGEWEYTGSLHTARYQHTATLLSDGEVLVAGGTGGLGGRPFLASAELYDQANGAWRATGSLNTRRNYHTATLLADGRVLVVGGYDGGDGYLASAELYDLATEIWTVTGSLNTGRSYHTATLLPDGRVLVAGGSDGFNNLASAELYDPATGIWTVTGSLNTARILQTATLLPNGEVLVAGGNGASGALASAELYDPVAGTWTFTGSLHTGRWFNSAVLLTDGKVLVADGLNPSEPSSSLASAELYDPATGIWSVTGSLNTAREDWTNTATLLPTGQVLVAGGCCGYIESSELYDPTTGTWTFTGSLNAARVAHTATLLPNGKVLAAGGLGMATLKSAELYDSGIVAAIKVDGRGSIEGQGDQATFNFHVMQTDDRAMGRFSFSDPGAEVSISKANPRSLTFTGKSAGFSGTARLGGGSKVTFDVSVTDNGDGSTDTFTISLSNGYSAGGTLTSGDIHIQ